MFIALESLTPGLRVYSEECSIEIKKNIRMVTSILKLLIVLRVKFENNINVLFCILKNSYISKEADWLCG